MGASKTDPSGSEILNGFNPVINFPDTDTGVLLRRRGYVTRYGEIFFDETH